jgi:hypothetical protein
MEEGNGSRPRLTFHEWLDMGMRLGYCSEPVCNTHDGLPSTEQEDAMWEDGQDPCIPAVRLMPEGRVVTFDN